MRKIIKKFLFFIFVFFRKKDSVIKTKIEETLKSYDVLINQYELIQQKKSELSAKQRKDVVELVNHLISIGHLKFNSK